MGFSKRNSTLPASTWNPVLINFQHIWRLIKDAWRTKNWLDKFRIWFMPTGWRPKDVAEKFPVKIIEDPYSMTKYETESSHALKIWSIMHLLVTTALMLFMFYNYENIGFNNLLIYGGIVFLGIYAYTSLMDKSKYSTLFEIVRTALALGIIYKTENWFGLNEYITYGSSIIGSYFIISTIGMIYFLYYEEDNLEKTSVAY